MKINYDCIDTYIEYLVTNQNVSNDGIIEKISISDLAAKSNKFTSAEIYYATQKAYELDYIDVEFDDQKRIVFITDVKILGHKRYQELADKGAVN